MDSKLVWVVLEHGSLLDTPQSLPLTVPLSTTAWGVLHALTMKITSKQ